MTAAVPAPAAAWPFSWKHAPLLMVEVVLVVAIGAAIDRHLTWLWPALVLAAGIIYWRASRDYRAWAIHRYDPYYWRQSTLAAVGLVLVLVAAWPLTDASAHNRPSLASVGIAMVLLGFMPVMHIVRHDVHQPAPGAAPPAPTSVWSYVVSWSLNLILIVAAVMPLLLILGARWFVPLLISGGWFASVAVDRLGDRPCYRIIVALSAVGIVGLLWVMLRAGVHGLPSTTVAVVVVGSFAAMLGLVDAISAWARHLPRSPHASATRVARATIGGVLCALAVVGGIVWLTVSLGGVSGSVQALVMVAFVGLGASFIARGQGFVLVVLVGGLVVWTVTDRTDHAPLDAVPSSTQAGTIVALGDSYIAGEGSQHFFPRTDVHGHNDCRRSSAAFPYLVAQHFRRHLVFAACSGAIADQIWNTAQIGHQSADDPIGALPQLNNPVTVTPDLVLVSIGGNDALFGDIGKGCALPGSCTDLRALFDGNLGSVRIAVATALERIGRRFPGSPVVVVPYPVMLFDRGCSAAPLDNKEVPYLRGFVQNLDATVHLAALDANATLPAHNIVYFADGEHAYAGQEVCNPAQTADPLNLIALLPTESDTLVDRVVPTNWTHNSFHPTEVGHRLMATSLESFLSTHFAAFGAAADRAVDSSAPTSTTTTPRCVGRTDCQSAIHDWMAEQIVRALRLVLLPLMLLLGAGWVAMFLVHRYFLAAP